jgi:hypothetical protein
MFNEMLGTWLRLSDTGSSVQSVSDYATAMANLPAETRGLPLASLSYLTPTSVSRIQNVAEEVRVAASVTHCKDQVKLKCCLFNANGLSSFVAVFIVFRISFAKFKGLWYRVCQRFRLVK